MKFKSFEPKKKLSWTNLVIGFLGNLFLIYCVAIGLMLIVFSSLTIECTVVGASMKPTFNSDSRKSNDVVFVNMYDRSFDYGDIIVVDVDGRSDPIIKRVVGVAGDVIDIVLDSDNLYKLQINNQIVQESYLNMVYTENLLEYDGDFNGMHLVKSKLESLKISHNELFIKSGENKGKILVPEGCVFALGDNRHNSQDSSYYGAFEFDKILGVVESSLSGGEGEFAFYVNYVIKGKVFETIANCN